VAGWVLKAPFTAILDAFRPALLAVTLMGGAVWGVLALTASLSLWIQLLAGVSIGALAYVGTLWVLDRRMVLEMAATLQSALLRRGAKAQA
jgi:hypothetical protein